MRKRQRDSVLVTAEDIRYAYRLLLGREPDPAGYSNHVKNAAGRARVADFAQSIMASDEYRTKHADAEMIPVALDGYVLYVSPSDGDVSTPIRQRQIYEPYVETVLRKILRRGDVFVDVGANIGYWRWPRTSSGLLAG